VSLQVFFAFPQFAQDEPVLAVEVGGEAVENAAALPVRRGRDLAGKLGDVVMLTGRAAGIWLRVLLLAGADTARRDSGGLGRLSDW